MVAEENPFVCRDEVAAIVVALAGSSACVIERENFGGDKSGIEPVRHQITADRSHDKPRRIERLAAIETDLGEPSRAQQGDAQPNDDREYSLHFAGFPVMLDLMNSAMSALTLARHSGSP